MGRYTRKRGGASHAAYPTIRRGTRKVLANRNRPGSRAAATLASRGIGISEYYAPPNTGKPRKTRKTRSKAANITEVEVRRSSRIPIQLAKKATREAAETKKQAEAAAKKTRKSAAAQEAAEEEEMERLREAELRQKVTRNLPVILPSSLTQPKEYAKQLKNYQNALGELGNMRKSRAPKSRFQRNSGAAPNLGELTLSTVSENNEEA
jgi:hypothetical protein